jgi:hypothetical protein
MSFHLGWMQMEKYIAYYRLHPCLWCVLKTMTKKRTPNLRIFYEMLDRAKKAF